MTTAAASIILSNSERQDFLALNRNCGCVPLDTWQIQLDIAQQWPQLPLAALLASRETLFAHSGVFVSANDVAQMTAVVAAIEAATQLPAFRLVLGQRAPELASRLSLNTRGLLMGYDFHLTAQGPQLIEVNTNAGGAGLVAALQQASGVKDAQCLGVGLRTLVPDVGSALANMVRQEWLRSGREGQPANIGIVDAAPDQEYLYPDMLLIQALLAQQGLRSNLIAASQLAWDGTTLSAQGQPVDMVYNRLTDFGLKLELNAALRSAWLAGAVVVSPAPEHHLLFADKRNLVFFSHPDHPALTGLAAYHQQALKQVPTTRNVEPANAAALWSERKQLFFKPVSGFAGRGAYRGNKLTKRVWQALQQEPYVAQALVPPAQRRLPAFPIELKSGQATEPVSKDRAGAQSQLLKFDVRLYTYAGQPLLLAARAYQGQTTNFRTPGGGFAPVFGYP